MRFLIDASLPRNTAPNIRGQVHDAVAWRIVRRFHGGLDGCFPGGAEVGGIGWGQVDEALVELGLGFGEGGEGVDAEEQGAGFGVVEVEDFDVYFHVWQGRFRAFPIEEDDHLFPVLDGANSETPKVWRPASVRAAG